MNIVDLIIITGLVLGALTGFIRGFFKETVVFLGTIVAVILAFILKNPISQLMYRNLPFFKFRGYTTLNIILYEVLAFIIVLAILLVILALIIKITGLIERILKMTIILAIPSKILGMIVGIIQSIVIMYVILFVLSIPMLKVKYINESKGANLILNHTPIISTITKDFVTSCKDISENVKLDINLSDTKETNTKIVEIMLKNKLVTTNNVALLVNNKKIDINNPRELIDTYKEA